MIQASEDNSEWHTPEALPGNLPHPSCFVDNDINDDIQNGDCQEDPSFLLITGYNTIYNLR
ncbi:predicted protein [Sclerotinia sclerotiorum 1980 UF-70]|uniref:Uncharacterized protein n=1 Tax=Sclerotinia sclerotiorum (strain ATCC 18683 / 1980 / Ss-1) TaxID=665079 RepID=A7F8L1_SCLS1|nr:predicted protein [Sclerotinia sclerotiorum 1980 UF-70]EDN99082.1 predicted protein [Sclerotinia sclerotiorum 1980 UF-70]